MSWEKFIYLKWGSKWRKYNLYFKIIIFNDKKMIIYRPIILFKNEKTFRIERF